MLDDSIIQVLGDSENKTKQFHEYVLFATYGAVDEPLTAYTVVLI